MSRIGLALLLMCLWAAPGYGQAWTVGFSDFHGQQYGSGGRRIAVDGDGMIHISYYGVRNFGQQAYYNLLGANGEYLISQTGTQLVSLAYSSLAWLAVSSSNRAYVVSCGGQVSQHPELLICGDFLPRAAAFLQYGPTNVDHVHPRIGLDHSGRLHIVSHSGSFDRTRKVYLRGIPHESGPLLDSVSFDREMHEDLFGEASFSRLPSAEVACSHLSDRVAILWLAPGTTLDSGYVFDNDVYMVLSEDGGENWTAPTNLTQFLPPDQALFDSTGNWQCADRDTLRARQDVSAVFDNDNELHVAFTTTAYYQWYDPELSRNSTAKAILWHWSEATDSASAIEAAWTDTTEEVGGYFESDRSILSTPVLSYDRENSLLYCSFVKYDLSQYSWQQFSADLFVSEFDDELGWSEPVNITNTTVESLPCPIWEFKSEEELSAAERIVNRRLYLLHEFDQMGVFNDDPFGNDYPQICRRVWLDTLGFTGHHTRPFRLNVDLSVCDSILPVGTLPIASDFSLEAYPNPFNSSVALEYTLPALTEVTLRIFDIQGREAAVFEHGQQTAGLHRALWTADAFASGVYFARLETSHHTQTTKLLLIK